MSLLSLLCICSCTDTTSDNVFTILTTTSILADTVRNIVKEDASVVSLMGPGIDPHTYQTTQKDVKKLTHADIIFYNGLYLEGKMSDLLGKIAENRKVYAVGDVLDPTQLIYDAAVFPLGVDPHIWFDIKLWKEIVAFISSKLQEARPESAVYYQRNTAVYLEALEVLHQEVTRQIRSIPEAQRVLITAHDAFGYFGRAYNIDVFGLQGVSTVSECGLQDIHCIVQLILARNIKAVFFETSVSDKSMRAVLEGCSHYGYKVKMGGSLYSDALDEPNTPAGTYCGMIQANTKAIVNALK
ncbi:MAG: zinc ABC transporter substrate-binding protein [Candidatus Cardinium sp.]|nr:zinc ABC transporter substrate-binding protein [Candidatus Cardinium sp.]